MILLDQCGVLDQCGPRTGPAIIQHCVNVSYLLGYFCSYLCAMISTHLKLLSLWGLSDLGKTELCENSVSALNRAENPKSPAVWACLGVNPLDMPRTPYRAREGKHSKTLHAISPHPHVICAWIALFLTYAKVI